MTDTTPRVIPIESIGNTARTVQRNALAMTGIYRLYISKGEQVDQANHSVIDGLAECFQAGGHAAVDACIAIARRHLTTTGNFPAGPLAGWLTDMAAATDGW